MLPRGRYAPSPTGRIHLGNARTALAAWLSVRSAGGSMVWRLEDLDGPRVVPGMADAALEDLAWLGLDWDEGPGAGGPCAPYRQSERTGHYERVLARLAEAGRLFPCRVSRRDLQEIASAPHGASGLPPYPISLRPAALQADWFSRHQNDPAPDAALRFRVDGEPVVFEDAVYGRIEECVELSVGDFVLKRRDGCYAYQLAVVADDLDMGITEVVRGADLLDSTARQIQLFRALGAPLPRFAHVPLVVNDRGEKLSKRDDALCLRALREAGVQPEAIVGYLGYSLGLTAAALPAGPYSLVESFRWDRIRREAWVVPSELPRRLVACR